MAACLVMPACGGSDDPAAPADEVAAETTDPAAIPGDAAPEDVEVINGWVTSLAAGDVDKAATYFAIPSVAENGGVLLEIESVGEARLFNESLPCGAELIHAASQGDFTTATFQLKERPGPGFCGPGKDSEAKTAFVIEDGKIVEWRRVGVVPQAPSGQAT
jgi:hypothetical protein